MERPGTWPTLPCWKMMPVTYLWPKVKRDKNAYIKQSSAKKKNCYNWTGAQTRYEIKCFWQALTTNIWSDQCLSVDWGRSVDGQYHQYMDMLPLGLTNHQLMSLYWPNVTSVSLYRHSGLLSASAMAGLDGESWWVPRCWSHIRCFPVHHLSLNTEAT